MNWDRFTALERPAYAWVLLAATLLGAAWLLTQLQSTTTGQDLQTVTIVGWLPRPWIESSALHTTALVAFALSSVAWLLQRGLPVSPLVASGSFLWLTATYFEQRSYLDHTFQATAMTLVLLAGWSVLYSAPIRAARAAKRFFATPLVPAWLPACFVFYLGLVYGLAGFAKLWDGGPGWANGVSLQLWTTLFADPTGWAARIILEHRIVAIALQTTTLVAELLAVFAVFVPAMRVPIGLTLLGFHVGQTLVFDWEFHSLTVLLALAFLPVRGLLNRRWPTDEDPAAPPVSG